MKTTVFICIYHSLCQLILFEGSVFYFLFHCLLPWSFLAHVIALYPINVRQHSRCFYNIPFLLFSVCYLRSWEMCIIILRCFSLYFHRMLFEHKLCLFLDNFMFRFQGWTVCQLCLLLLLIKDLHDTDIFSRKLLLKQLSFIICSFIFDVEFRWMWLLISMTLASLRFPLYSKEILHLLNSKKFFFTYIFW